MTQEFVTFSTTRTNIILLQSASFREAMTIPLVRDEIPQEEIDLHLKYALILGIINIISINKIQPLL